MARLARSSLPGYPHHVIQRGNYEQRVFEVEDDYLRYSSLLKEYIDRYALDVWAYCLMPTHVHCICVPRSEGGLARCFNSLHMRYAQYFHAKKGLTGHLWRARFLSCMLDLESAIEEARFIENDPVRSGIVTQAEDYLWSSARYHVLGLADPLINDEDDLLKHSCPDWPAFLIGECNEGVLKNTWRCLKTGRPAGSLAWVKELEGVLGRPLIGRPRGRPKKLLRPAKAIGPV